MGLWTAYFASRFSKKVAILERSTINNGKSSSAGYSRSIRNDYVDPFYSCLAAESRYYWNELDKKVDEDLIIKCGVLNIAKRNLTPNLQKTYAESSYQTMKSLGFETKKYNRKELKKVFPQFNADLATLDVDAGFLRIPELTDALVKDISRAGVEILENNEVIKIDANAKESEIILANGSRLSAKKVVITAGPWINKIIKNIVGFSGGLLPIVPIMQTVKFFKPKKSQEQFKADKLPVFAYLDVGIYGHPMYKSPGVKIAYFDPTGATLVKKELNVQAQSKIQGIRDFIRECMPELKGSRLVKTKEGYYSMTPDNNFIIDRLPGFENIFVGGGFCGTGYKFAPVVGKILAELSYRDQTVYDIKRFSAKRFGKLWSLSMLKSLPIYAKYLKPKNWKYARTGISALQGKLIPE